MKERWAYVVVMCFALYATASQYSVYIPVGTVYCCAVAAYNSKTTPHITYMKYGTGDGIVQLCGVAHAANNSNTSLRNTGAVQCKFQVRRRICKYLSLK
jgi:hypothetical protein